MSNADNLKKYIFGGNMSKEINLYYTPPIKGYIRKLKSLKQVVNLRLATLDDFDLCCDWITKYNTKYNIDFLGDVVHRSCKDIIENSGCFIIVEQKGEVIAMTYISITSINSDLDFLKDGKVFSLGNLMLCDKLCNKRSMYTGLYSSIFKIISEMVNWGECFFMDINFFTGVEVIWDMSDFFCNCSGTVISSHFDDLFCSSLVGIKDTQKNEMGYVPRFIDTLSCDVNVLLSDFNNKMHELFPERSDCMTILPSDDVEDLSYFTSGEYTKDTIITLPLDFISCNSTKYHLVSDIEVERVYNDNGFYYPLLISPTKELVGNFSTYWYLLERGVKYVSCILV